MYIKQINLLIKFKSNLVLKVGILTKLRHKTRFFFCKQKYYYIFNYDELNYKW